MQVVHSFRADDRSACPLKQVQLTLGCGMLVQVNQLVNTARTVKPPYLGSVDNTWLLLYEIP
jgi:hypothetical protein